MGIKTGRYQLLAEYGVDTDTGKTFPVSSEHPSKLGAKFSLEIGEWIMQN